MTTQVDVKVEVNDDFSVVSIHYTIGEVVALLLIPNSEESPLDAHKDDLNTLTTKFHAITHLAIEGLITELEKIEEDDHAG